MSHLTKMSSASQASRQPTIHPLSVPEAFLASFCPLNSLRTREKNSHPTVMLVRGFSFAMVIAWTSTSAGPFGRREQRMTTFISWFFAQLNEAAVSSHSFLALREAKYVPALESCVHYGGEEEEVRKQKRMGNQPWKHLFARKAGETIWHKPIQRQLWLNFSPYSKI